MISPLVGFTVSILLTLSCLAGAVFTGLKARRRKHLVFVTSAFLMLVATIWFALELGKLYDLESAGWITPVHMTMARLTTAAYILPLITGLLTIKNPKRRPLHGRVAIGVLLCTVATAATGVLMLLWSTPL